MNKNSGFRKWFALILLVFTLLAVTAAPLWAEKGIGGYDETIG